MDQFNFRVRRLAWRLSLVLLILLLAACDQRFFGNRGSNNLAVGSAAWDESKQQISLAGTTQGNGDIVVNDGIGGNLLATVNPENGNWSAEIQGFACSVTVTQGSDSVTQEVANAPAACASFEEKRIESRALASPSVRAAATSNNPLATWPEGVILSPSEDKTIDAGRTLTFAAIANDPTGQRQFNYVWDFGGAQPNSFLQNPGPITFNIPGTFIVRLAVTNALGVSDPTPATRVIVVRPSSAAALPPTFGNPFLTNPFPGSPFPPSPFPTAPTPVAFPTPGVAPFVTPPVPQITSPNAQQVFVNVGEPVRFRGDAYAPGVNSNGIRFYWDFGGAQTNPSPNVGSRDAGSLSFLTPGTFYVRLNAQTDTGVSSVQPAFVMVTVLGGTAPGGFGGTFPPVPGTAPFPGAGGFAGNLPPTGVIASPGGDILVRVGDQVDLSGDGFDPDNNVPLSFRWDFAGAASNENGRTARVRFRNPGVVQARLRVRDSLGNEDPNPPFRTITVVSNTLPVGGGFGAPAPTFPPFPSPTPSPFPPPSPFPTPFPTPTPFPGVPSTGFGLTTNEIISPPTDVTVNVGESITFIGQAATGLPEAQLQPLNYLWNFDGAAPASTQLSPGTITFVQPGRYHVRFFVANAAGQVVGSAGHRDIQVRGQSGLPPLQSLANPIVSPQSSDITIVAGEQVLFAASDIPPQPGTQLRYNWNFSNGISPDINQAYAGFVRFDRPGRFDATLRLQLVDFQGNTLSNSRFRVNVNVNAPGGFGGIGGIGGIGGGTGAFAGDGIRLPSSDQVVQVGSSLDFESNTIDQNQFSNVNFRWQFNQFSGNPGNRIGDVSGSRASGIRFNSTGEFEARLNVSATERTTGQNVSFSGARRILVVPGAGGVPFAQPPVSSRSTLRARIETPRRAETVQVGRSLDFAASVSGVSAGAQVAYEWDFGGAASNTRSQVPGRVSFNRIGDFNVTLRVQDSQGNFDPDPPRIQVRVTP